MGMYDEVSARCHVCDAPIVFQSEAGECVLATHPNDSVPLAIADDIEGDLETCSTCGTTYTIEKLIPIQSVPMYIRPAS